MSGPDKERLEQFRDRMLGLVNDSFLALMISIGHQTGLLEAMSSMPPSSSEAIAKAAGLNERYVREWLGAMVTGRVVAYDPGAAAYSLPPEHAASLTDGPGRENLAVKMQYLSCMGSVEQEIVDCFRQGGGLGYDRYRRFHAIMQESSAQGFSAGLLTRVLPLVEGIQDRLAAGIDVLDVACGSGRAVNLMARAFPKSRCKGIDFSAEAVEAARREAREWGLDNAVFEEGDVAALPPVSFDLVTAFDAIHDQARPRDVLAAVAGALRDGGTFLMVDSATSSRLEKNLDHPLGPFLYSVSTLHCMSVSLGLGGEGLGTCWGEELAREILAGAGFGHVEVKKLEGDAFNNYYICRRG